MTRRDRVVVAAAAVVGLLLGALAAWSPEGVGAAAEWLRRGTAAAGPATPEAEPSVLPDAPHADRDVLSEVREAVREGRIEDAKRRLDTHRLASGRNVSVALEVERQALQLLLAPAGFRADMASQSAGWVQQQGPARNWEAWDHGQFAALLLEHVPGGLGRPSDPGRAHARAYVAATLVRAGGGPYRREMNGALVALVDGDAARLVDVIGAWGDLLPHLEPGDVLVDQDRVRRQVCTELCQAVLDATDDPRPLCDGLSAIAGDDAWAPRDRAVAAMALAELANLPIALDHGLPKDDADAATWRYPADEIVAAWEKVRDLAPEKALVARVEIAIRDRGPSPGRAGPGRSWRWVAMRLGGGRDFDSTRNAAREIAAGSLVPEVYLAMLAPGTEDAGEIVNRMTGNILLALPLHELLTLRGAAGDARPPRFVASADWNGVASAWRTALGLDAVPFTVRVARLERRLDAPSLRDGLTLVDETLRAATAEEPVETTWAQTIDDGRDPPPGWRAPGALAGPLSRTRMTEKLRLVVGWTDEGAGVRVEDLEVSIRHARGGGSSSTSGASWPVGVPVALAPWSDADSPASRRAYLVHVTQEEDPGDAWTLDDWRSAVAEAFDRRQALEDAPLRSQRGLRQLGETIALLRPEIDLERLATLRREAGGLGPGVARALLLGGGREGPGETTKDEAMPGDVWQSLEERDLAELALEGVDADVREAMWAALVAKRPTVPVAQELLALAEASPERVPDDAVRASQAAIARSVGLSDRPGRWAVAGLIWLATVLVAAWWVRRRKRPNRARGAAAVLVVVALFLAQTDVSIEGWELLPAWAGWGLAALAVRWLARDVADAEARIPSIAFAVTAAASALALFAGTVAEVVAAVAALTGCVALAPVAPAMLRGLGPCEDSTLPRKPPRAGWRTGVRVAIPAAIAAGALVGASMLRPHEIVESALFYVAFATCFGGVFLWRMSLTRFGTGGALPAPFVAGLLVPGLVLLVTDTASRVADATTRELPTPFDAVTRVWIFCALLFVLLRLFDAARLRGRADTAAAQVLDRTGPGPTQGSAPTA